MKLFNFTIFSLIIFMFVSCEEVIEINLNDVSPKYVIEADLNDLTSTQEIKVTQTVNFDAPYPNKAVDNARVSVTDVDGVVHEFANIGSGVYRKTNFKPSKNGKYSLKVSIDDKEFLSTTERVPYVNIDSIGVVGEEIFNEFYYIITIKFHDPIDQVNYYKYSYSVNNGPFKFAAVYSDKFNNGLFVTHEITERDKDKKFIVDDSVVIKRECISKDVYTFWNQIQSLNPGSAAPANPDSNISNGALGYFSVSSAKLYSVTIEEFEE